MINAVLIDEKDDVVTVTGPIKPGQDVVYSLAEKECCIKALDEIPIYHKVAVKAVTQGSDVIKYGEKIGFATKAIAVGEHVHTHNVGSKKED